MPSQASEITHPSSDLDPEVLIKVDNVSKKFCRDFKKSLWYGLKDTATDIVHPTHRPQDSQLRPGEFWANQNISFEVKRGECLGLIGHNGAGKTTLLKMLNGLMKPDTGSIEMHGRIGALIALGAGFNPILTGRENVYVNGSILGLHKEEIDAKLDEIIDFAEIEEAMDAPVRTYSSGMQVRLGFAVAVILVQPDVLLLDEVLAVGDMAFTIKCLNAVRQLTDRSAVVFVSHNVQFVSQFCSKIMLLKNGEVELFTDKVSEGIESYLSACEQVIEMSGTGEATVDNEILSTASRTDIVEPRSVLPEDSLAISLTLDIAQTMHEAKSGAYTGEISAEMLTSIGLKSVILGHSERREYFGEDDALLAKKVDAALANDLEVIFCFGEVLEDRKSGNHFSVVESQISNAIFHLEAAAWSKIVLAYEPVWAIGTGETATADQAQEMHAFIRKTISDKYGNDIAQNVSILYGGSCKPSNAKEIFSKEDFID